MRQETTAGTRHRGGGPLGRRGCQGVSRQLHHDRRADPTRPGTPRGDVLWLPIEQATAGGEGSMATTIAADAVIAGIEGEYRRRTPRSAALFAAATEVVPGGTSRSGVAFRPYPLVIRQGQGCRIVDADGHEYVDFLNANSALIHGHAHPAITAAIQQQAA